jgi:hypothetical protein
MKRAFFLRVLLSLLLLVTQQMAVGHAMSHWTGSADTAARSQADGKHKPAKMVADDQGCSECLAYAQLASVIGSPAHSVPALAVAALDAASPFPAAVCARTVCVFQSRAPPQA